MMENKKAIEQLERISKNLGSIGETEDYTEVAIQALEEVQKYRDICKAEVLEWATKLLKLSKKCGTIGKVIDECAEYEEIGTVEECRMAVEKQLAKKVVSFDYHNGTVNYGCPVCKRKIISKVDDEWCGGTFNEYCDRCGQKLDWSV